MKLFLNTTLALSTLCILEVSRPAQATLSNDANFHLARGRGGGMREAPRPVEENRSEYSGEGRNQDVSGEAHTSEASRAEDYVHTLDGSKDTSSGGVSDGGRVHDAGKYDNGEDWGAGCESGMVVDGVCVPSTGNTTSIPSTGWTTVQ